MSTEYWIEIKDQTDQWIPVDKAYSHRDAQRKFNNKVEQQKQMKVPPKVRVLKVTWEIINM
jgi:hypothetical protein